MTSRKIPESAVENLVSDLEGKANVSNTVTTNTAQTITAAKNLSVGGTVAYSRPFQIFMPTSTESNPTEKKAREIAFVATDGAGERYEGSLSHTRSTTGESYTGLRAGRLVNGTYKEGALGVRTLADGTTFGTAPSTPANPANTVIVTADYLKNNYVDKTSTQTISSSKRFTTPAEGMSIELVADTNQQTIPSTTTLRQLGFYRNATYTKGDGFTSWVQGYRGSDGWTTTELYTRRFLEGDSQEIINYIKIAITPDGTPISYTRTPPANSAGEEIVTAGWVRNACLLPGEIIIWSAPTPPAGYLICDGSAISRTTYARLFQVIGTTWGAGDGNTTFNIPNLYLLSDIKVKGYTALGLTTYSAPNVPSSKIGNIYRFNEPAGASGPFVMFNQNVQNQGIGLTSDVNNTGLAYQKTTFKTKFCIRY